MNKKDCHNNHNSVIAISIGLYTILPLFTNTVIDEPLPTASGVSLSTWH